MQQPQLNFELYKIFYHAATQMNFSKAAEVLHVTQSAVSQAIKSLETQLGVLLFHRQSRNVTLAYEGEVLFQHVEKRHFIFYVLLKTLCRVSNRSMKGSST